MIQKTPGSGPVTGNEFDNAHRRDPARKFKAAPPNMGRPVMPTVHTFQGIVSTIAKTFRSPDEAIKHSLDNARYMRNDIGVMECLEQRMRSVALLDWHIEVDGPDLPHHKALQERMTSILRATRNFTKYRYTLSEAIWYGRYAIQHRFGWKITPNGRDIIVDDWLPINGDKLVFRQDDGSDEHPRDEVGIRVGAQFKPHDLIDGRIVVPTEAGLATFLAPHERAMVAIHKYLIEDAAYESPLDAGSIHGVGIRSRIYWEWFQKQEMLGLFLEFLERAALGFEIWYYPEGNDSAYQDVKNAAENRNGRKTIVLFPKPLGDTSMAYGVEHIEPNPGGIEAFQNLLNGYFGHRIKRYILGQVLTSEAEATGLGSGVADLHLQTMLDIVKFDATNLEETITRDLLRPLKIYNDATAHNVDMRFVIQTQLPDVEAKLAGMEKAWNMGARLKESDVLDAIGAAIPEPDEPTLQNPQATAQGQQQMAAMQGQGGDPNDPNAAAAPQGDLTKAAGMSPNSGADNQTANQLRAKLVGEFHASDAMKAFAKLKETVGQDTPGINPSEGGEDDEDGWFPGGEDDGEPDDGSPSPLFPSNIPEPSRNAREGDVERYWDESDHPRDADGKFTEGEGEASAAEQTRVKPGRGQKGLFDGPPEKPAPPQAPEPEPEPEEDDPADNPFRKAVAAAFAKINPGDVKKYANQSGKMVAFKATPEQIRGFNNSVRAILNTFSPKSAERIGKSVKKIEVHSDTLSVTRAYASASGQRINTKESRVGGYFAGQIGELVVPLEKDMGDMQPASILAHELGHAIDFDRDAWERKHHILDARFRYSEAKLSSDTQWRVAYQDEIKYSRQHGYRLSEYANKNESEGFAEFARFIFENEELAKEKFPKCYAFWEKHGLIGKAKQAAEENKPSQPETKKPEPPPEPPKPPGPPKTREIFISGISPQAKAEGNRVREATGKYPFEISASEFESTIDPSGAKWQNKQEHTHLEWVKRGVVLAPERIPTSVLQEYADRDPSIMNELTERRYQERQKQPKSNIVGGILTRKEWHDNQRRKAEKAGQPYDVQAANREYKQHIVAALEAGQDVPAAILRDYPDLQARNRRPGEVLRYARWVTIGAHEGDGGTPVLIDDNGHIHAGPKKLTGQNVSSIGKKPPQSKGDPKPSEPAAAGGPPEKPQPAAGSTSQIRKALQVGIKTDKSTGTVTVTVLHDGKVAGAFEMKRATGQTGQIDADVYLDPGIASDPNTRKAIQDEMTARAKKYLARNNAKMGNVTHTDQQPAKAQAPRERMRGQKVDDLSSQLVAREAEDWGLPPEELAKTLDHVYQMRADAYGPMLKAIEQARGETGLTPKQMAHIENTGGDVARIPGLDTKARELAASYPELGLGRGAEGGANYDDRDLAQELWHILRNPPPKPSKTDPQLIRQAAEMLYNANKAGMGSGDADGGGWEDWGEHQATPEELEAVPFAKRGDVERYYRPRWKYT